MERKKKIFGYHKRKERTVQELKLRGIVHFWHFVATLQCSGSETGLFGLSEYNKSVRPLQEGRKGAMRSRSCLVNHVPVYIQVINVLLLRDLPTHMMKFGCETTSLDLFYKCEITELRLS